MLSKLSKAQGPLRGVDCCGRMCSFMFAYVRICSDMFALWEKRAARTDPPSLRSFSETG